MTFFIEKFVSPLLVGLGVVLISMGVKDEAATPQALGAMLITVGLNLR